MEYYHHGSSYNENKIRIEKVGVEDSIIKKELNILYVGGISKHIYIIKKLLKVISQKENINLTICCREKEWEANKEEYKKYLNERINVVHVWGKELEEYYLKADICSLFVKPTEYMSMASPIKLYEYLSNIKPIIAIKDTVAGDFVKKNECGWTIKYDDKELSDLLDYLIKNKQEIYIKSSNMINVLKNNTWEERAKTVVVDLK